MPHFLYSPFCAFILGLTFLAGCSTLEGPSLKTERYMACPQDSVWKGALQALEHYPITLKDRHQGIIKTDWRVQPVQGRAFGLFGRENMGDKERARLTFSMKSLQAGVVAITLTERRQHWGFVGGARLYKWYPVEPSQQEIQEFMKRLTAVLDKEDCIIES